MAAAPLPTLCDGLADLAASFERFAHRSGAEFLVQDNAALPITGEEGRRYLNLIKALQHLALLQERELGALRMLVGEIPGRVETPAVTEGNIIRPNFGGKKHDSEA